MLLESARADVGGMGCCRHCELLSRRIGCGFLSLPRACGAAVCRRAWDAWPQDGTYVKGTTPTAWDVVTTDTAWSAEGGLEIGTVRPEGYVDIAGERSPHGMGAHGSYRQGGFCVPAPGHRMSTEHDRPIGWERIDLTTASALHTS